MAQALTDEEYVSASTMGFIAALFSGMVALLFCMMFEMGIDARSVPFNSPGVFAIAIAVFLCTVMFFVIGTSRRPLIVRFAVVFSLIALATLNGWLNSQTEYRSISFNATFLFAILGMPVLTFVVQTLLMTKMTPKK